MERPEKKLTDRQSMVLMFIANQIEEDGYPPTIREIGDHLSIRSTNGVNDHLKALEKKGYIKRKDSKSRALTPLFFPDGTPFDIRQRYGASTSTSTSTSTNKSGEESYSIPIVGRIAAGTPIAAIENVESHVSIGQSLIGQPTDVFGLTVHGESMIEDGIFDGDYIFVKKQITARNGEIVAAMVDGEATVKRFFKEEGRIRLQPANSTMEPIYIYAHEAKDTAIIGKVIGVFRKL